MGSFTLPKWTPEQQAIIDAETAKNNAKRTPYTDEKKTKAVDAGGSATDYPVTPKPSTNISIDPRESDGTFTPPANVTNPVTTLPDEGPVAEPTTTNPNDPNYVGDPSATYTASQRRKRIAALRRGLASTIKTGPLGITTNPQTLTPSVVASGLKTKLGV